MHWIAKAFSGIFLRYQMACAYEFLCCHWNFNQMRCEIKGKQPILFNELWRIVSCVWNISRNWLELSCFFRSFSHKIACTWFSGAECTSLHKISNVVRAHIRLSYVLCLCCFWRQLNSCLWAFALLVNRVTLINFIIGKDRIFNVCSTRLNCFNSNWNLIHCSMKKRTTKIEFPISKLACAAGNRLTHWRVSI